MFTPEVNQSKSEYFDHFVPSMMPNNNLISSTFLSPTPSNYSDSGSYQQSPLSVYNNYNPNFHHHHYYFHANFQDYNGNHTQTQAYGNVQDSGSNWLRKYDCENQKEYFIANTPPTPSECCDFEVPQKLEQSSKSTPTKLFHDLDKIFFDDENLNKIKTNSSHNAKIVNDSFNFWESESFCSEKSTKKVAKSREKVRSESCGKAAEKCGKTVKGTTNDQGERWGKMNNSFWLKGELEIERRSEGFRRILSCFSSSFLNLKLY
jgi:hypothetical protein